MQCSSHSLLFRGGDYARTATSLALSAKNPAASAARAMGWPRRAVYVASPVYSLQHLPSQACIMETYAERPAWEATLGDPTCPAVRPSAPACSARAVAELAALPPALSEFQLEASARFNMPNALYLEAGYLLTRAGGRGRG